MVQYVVPCLRLVAATVISFLERDGGAGWGDVALAPHHELKWEMSGKSR